MATTSTNRKQSGDQVLSNPPLFTKTKRICFVHFFLFVSNGLFLYLCSLKNPAYVSSFYGLSSNDAHLLRNTAVLCFIPALLNLFVILENNKTIEKIAILVNIFVICHYFVETFYFAAIRLEVMLGMLVFLIWDVIHVFSIYKIKTKPE